jgi:GrpB-like predicted nucleotidyltransferase (UPF0157 family)
MIGLTRHTVKIVDHDPNWGMLAVAACQAVRSACGKLLVDLQHVGSTAVPDLPAKPVLYIAATVVTFDSIPEIVLRLTRLGYIYRGDKAGGHLFVAESAPDIRTAHLHVDEHGSGQWRDYLRFRDLLRRSPAIRKRYVELKMVLASNCRNDSKSYTASKADFIREVLDNDVNCKDASGDESSGE